MLAVAAVSREKWVSVEEPVIVFPLHDPYLSLLSTECRLGNGCWLSFLVCFFSLLVIPKLSLGELILDLMMLMLRVWMEELDVRDLAKHAALHLLPAAAAARVNKLGFLNDGMCLHVSGTVHDVHL